jgi:hypothetical protein
MSLRSPHIFNCTLLKGDHRDRDLKEYIASGITKEEFSRRLRVVFDAPSQSTTSSSSHIPAATVTLEMPTALPLGANQASPTTSASPVASTLQESSAVQEMIAERAIRLKIVRKEKEAAEKAKRRAEANARKAAMEDEALVGNQKSADLKYALMQKQRQLEARAERERILKRVEDDKAERRERELQRKAQPEAEGDPGKVEDLAASTLCPTSKGKTAQCALQIRLFDGSTIRSRFPCTGSLRGDVRPWIDEQLPGDTPYTFKQVLTPLTNKNVSISEEEQSLYSQGLAPSATLILVPVQDYSHAYESGVLSSIMARAVRRGYGMVSSGLGLVSGVFGGLLGGGDGTPTPPNPITIANSTIIARTLAGPDLDRDDEQVYNGNAVRSLHNFCGCNRINTYAAELRTEE